jgi:ketosteroid isomerase-like protein
MAANPCSYPKEKPERQSRLRLACSLVIGAVLLSFLLASCRPTQPTDPVSVVQTAYERLNKGDLDGFMKFVSDDIVLVDPNGRFAGRQAVHDFLKSMVVEGTHRYEISNLSRDGNIVNYDINVYVANQLVDSGKGLDVVVDGLIAFEGVKGSLLSECEKDPSQAFCPEK